MLNPSSIRGFTLVEVMVVIVIMAILASLIVFNVGSTDHRKALQAREIFLLDIQKIRREANDQARVIALNIEPQTDVSPFRYSAVQWQKNANNLSLAPTWQPYVGLKTQSLPKDVRFDIQATDYAVVNPSNSPLLQANAPKLIFLGNGEVKPVRIQFYLVNEVLGAEINIDHLGKINES